MCLNLNGIWVHRVKPALSQSVGEGQLSLLHLHFVIKVDMSGASLTSGSLEVVSLKSFFSLFPDMFQLANACFASSKVSLRALR